MKLEDQFTAAMLAAGNKRSSITCYWRHVIGFIRFTSERHGDWIHPAATKIEDVHAWRRHLAKDIKLSPKTQNQAVSAIKFLFSRVLEKPLAETEENPLRAKEPNRCRRRVVAKPDLIRLFNAFRPADRLVPQLMYASVLRLSDVLNLRIKDLNFADEQIEIASTKHDHFRIVPFPKSIHDKVRRQVEIAERFHRDDDHQRRIFRDAVRRSGIRRRITPHDIRRAAATHLHLSGMPLKRLQAILGHNSLDMTQLYILEDEAQINGTHSPFDLLNGLD